ncbi:MAG: hypothetical protein CGU28_09365 [Candidatus Dactylopiibacterium carminicum]|uniref:General secretion pathway protein GspM n=1 Tax=Candidatus Dactylopiibacterium carminicum TaxID=857335 RepID=A0A272EQY0_9RHOO|nr:type II secretion system protein GspM [Candidatus Dactylopiibacterium carminicum]KAF7598699.1 hypothetical protein BGI27_11900 [Candidatus Dactylopiibacterium carminicum]PAS92517.1 MAG: hypothetical protein CGU29_11295 [Candidatus Dactylopiibacterium carminicum]PAS96313.1 MAG: hypothetical protein CGU28_09365 [Candidatus Dactylopiibacterium carminicum]PAS98566.1 MAG: hypothetical protein BSR46_11915 [Candidatus Dactylopiibacterium carminicum]
MKSRMLSLQSQAVVWWQARQPRERLALSVATGILVCVCWYLLASGLQQNINRMQRQLPELMHNSFEIAAGTRAAPPAPPVTTGADLRSDIFRLLAEREQPAELRALSVGSVEMRLPAAPGARQLETLHALRLGSGARVKSIQIQNGDDGLSEVTATLERQP